MSEKARGPQAGRYASEAAKRRLIAFPAKDAAEARIVPAPRARSWMDDTAGRWANRCLPLVIANEAGWMLLNPQGFEAVWSGDNSTDGVAISYDDGRPARPLTDSYFGYGILTWTVPYLFRTPPGYNLLARGPSNWPKDGIAALEGLVETDWAVATFTMNWKFTRPNHPVRFEENEPYCMVVPQRRGELEAFRPEIIALSSDPETHAATKAWAESRHALMVGKFLGEYSVDHQDDRGAWQGDYYRGVYPDGRPAPAHQKHLRLRGFEPGQL